jgi:hypothetical protein
MFVPAKNAIRAWIEAHYSALPMRWANEDWPGADPQATRDPFIECELIGGTNELRGFSSPGNRLWIHHGVFRFYVWQPWNTGMDAAYATADEFAVFMERAEFGRDEATGRTVRTLDFSVHANVAADEAGNYVVLLCSVPFDFYYTN